MIEDLAANRLPSAFLYESSAQSERWLAVHRAFSPFINDSSCRALYDWIAARAADRITESNVHVVGLGCGSGAKDSMLLEKLNKPVYLPVDISQKLVLEAAVNSSASSNRPLVLDLARAQDVGRFFDDQIPGDSIRVYTLFGLLPNFNTQILSGLLRDVLKSGDHLLLSANLAPGNDYTKSVERITAQYDNPVTRDWLVGALDEMGVKTREGRLAFGQREIHAGLRQILARWQFEKQHSMEFSGHSFTFESGDELEVFCSIRYTMPKVKEWLKSEGLNLLEYRSSESREEAVFFCQVL
jgi:uncharacterized SAM-dependent methyltransferase